MKLAKFSLYLTGGGLVAAGTGLIIIGGMCVADKRSISDGVITSIVGLGTACFGGLVLHITTRPAQVTVQP